MALSEPVHWLKPAVRCPNCGRPPAYRISAGRCASYYTHDPDEELYSYRCHVDWCRTTYVIRARDLAAAS